MNRCAAARVNVIAELELAGLVTLAAKAIEVSSVRAELENSISETAEPIDVAQAVDSHTRA